MAKQRLGEKKLARCREVGAKPYVVAFVRGGYPHFTAECWYTPHDADWVNYRDGGEVKPYIRGGKFVDTGSLACRVMRAAGVKLGEPGEPGEIIGYTE